MSAFPSLVCAKAGHKVYGIDVNEELIDHIECGNMPFIEHGGEKLLNDQLKK